jgi:hypothetical protein
MMAVRIATAPAFAASDPQRLFEGYVRVSNKCVHLASES